MPPDPNLTPIPRTPDQFRAHAELQRDIAKGYAPGRKHSSNFRHKSALIYAEEFENKANEMEVRPNEKH